MCVLQVQVKGPPIGRRWGHSGSVIAHSQLLTEIVIFGGRSIDLIGYELANTTVLQFGKSTSCGSHD